MFSATELSARASDGASPVDLKLSTAKNKIAKAIRCFIDYLIKLLRFRYFRDNGLRRWTVALCNPAHYSDRAWTSTPHQRRCDCQRDSGDREVKRVTADRVAQVSADAGADRRSKESAK